MKPEVDSTVADLRKRIEPLLTIPCCHISGMHDPYHFDNKDYVCNDQLKEAFFSLLDRLGIEWVKVESRKGCGWCNYNESHPAEKTKHSHKTYWYNVKTGAIRDGDKDGRA
jgi:hypothetical protein